MARDAGLTVIEHEVATHAIPARSMARLHVANIAAWGPRAVDDGVATRAELDDLAERLAGIGDGDVAVGVGTVVAVRSGP